MATHFTTDELDGHAHVDLTAWCVCRKAHKTFCIEVPCHWGEAWPHPFDLILSMETCPWMTDFQVARRDAYRAQKAG